MSLNWRDSLFDSVHCALSHKHKKSYKRKCNIVAKRKKLCVAYDIKFEYRICIIDKWLRNISCNLF